MSGWDGSKGDVMGELTKEVIDDLFDAAEKGPGPMEEIAAEKRALDYITLRFTGPKEKAMERQMMEGFPVKPMHDYIFVADLGQPNLTQGGITLPDEAFKFARYKYLNERYGIVVAIGPGRMMHSRKEGLCVDCSWPCRQGSIMCPKLGGIIDEGLELGSTVMFNRRFGSRLGVMFQPPGWAHPLFVRVLDPEKVLCIAEEFEPWWDVERGVMNPDLVMSG